MERNTLLAIVAAVALVVSTGGVAFAAAPSVDSETTDTAQTSDITEDSSQTHNTTTSSNLSYSADSTNAEVEIDQGSRELLTAAPDHYAENSTAGTYYYNVSIADSGEEYSGLEVGANENASLVATITNNTTVDSPDTTTVNYTFVNGEAVAFVAVTDAEADSSAVDIVTKESILSSLGIGDSEEENAAQAEQTTNITDNTSEVRVQLTNATVSDAFSAAISETDSSAFAPLTSVMVEDTRVPVFVGDAEDVEWIDTEDDAYATVSSDGSTITVHNPTAAEDVDSGSVDVTATGNDAPGFRSTVSMLRSYGAGVTTWATAGAQSIGYGSPF